MLSLNLHRTDGGELRVLCLGAHCDDIEIGCGGTLLSLIASNRRVAARWVVFASNDERAGEGRASAEAFLRGAQRAETVVMAYRDGYLPFQGALVKDEFESLKGDFQPDLVFTHYREDRHQDHRLISDLTWNTFRDHLILEYEVLKYDGDLGQPNLYVPLDEPVCRTKIRHLVESFPSQRRKPWFDPDAFLAIMRLRGMEANSPSGFAEAFYCRKAVLG